MADQLGQELRDVRRALGLSLKAVAGPAGISATYLQKLEAGDVQNPSPNVLRARNARLASTVRMACSTSSRAVRAASTVTYTHR